VDRKLSEAAGAEAGDVVTLEIAPAAEDDTKGVPRGLDVIGLLLLSPGLVLFLYGSDHLGEQTGVTAILLSIILLAAFVFKASKDRQRTGNDVHLSMAGEIDSALWYQRDIHRRRDGSVFGDVTFSLFKLPSSESADSRRHAIHSRHGHECGGYSVHFCRLWIAEELGK
jgi:hypothetical protein